MATLEVMADSQETNIGYKVVVRNNGKLSSVMADWLKDYSLDYPPQEWVIPKIGGIFLFKTYDNALDFYKDMTLHSNLPMSYEIWKCEVKNPAPVVTVWWLYTGTIEGFWTEGAFSSNAPCGSFMCDSVKLTERIKYLGSPDYITI